MWHPNLLILRYGIPNVEASLLHLRRLPSAAQAQSDHFSSCWDQPQTCCFQTSPNWHLFWMATTRAFKSPQQYAAENVAFLRLHVPSPVALPSLGFDPSQTMFNVYISTPNSYSMDLGRCTWPLLAPGLRQCFASRRSWSGVSSSHHLEILHVAGWTDWPSQSWLWVSLGSFFCASTCF